MDQVNRAADCAHIEAELAVRQWQACLQHKRLVGGVETVNFGLNEGHVCIRGESAQIDGDLINVVEASYQPWHHAGIKRAARAIYKGY